MKELKTNVLDISHNHYEYLMNLKNVNGVGLGYKYINGIKTNELCIHVLVKEKVPTEYLTKNNIIPKRYMGIKTDVREVQNIIMQNNYEEEKVPGKFRPLEGGCSINPFNYPGDGTLGCIVTKVVKEEKNFYMLSNNHVLALNNKVQIGTAVIQPLEDLGGSVDGDIVARLSNFIRLKPITFNQKPVNHVDCALAKLINPELATNKIHEIGEVKGVAKPELDLEVKKVGFVTGLTKGKITTVGLTTKIETIPLPYKRSDLLLFEDQIMADMISTGGDSGSVILNSNNEVVGLLMAGNGIDKTTFNDINIVIEKLKIEIYTG